MIKTVDNVSSLFEKMTITEIQDYEKKTRLEIEKLKEDLRVMVGERYRDLIEAADTIGDMKESVEKITEHVRNMHSFTSKPVERPKETEKKKLINSQSYYSVATEIKLLVDIPSKIWINIESEDFLKAAQLYLFAQHVNTNLEFEIKQKRDLFGTQFDIISRQWTSTVQFRGIILSYCQDVMKAPGMDEQKLVKAICALMFLTESTPRKLCSDFLITKMNVLENILSFHLKASNVKEQIASVISLIMETISVTFLVFYPTDNGNSLLSNVAKDLSDKTLNDFSNQVISQRTTWTKHLPSTVLGFFPSLQVNSTIISEEFLKETCLHWIATVKQALGNGVVRILSYVNSVKGLATLQESLEETFLLVCKNETWIRACNVIFQKQLNVWEEFLSQLFVDRIKLVIESQIEKSFIQFKTNLDDVFIELNSDRVSFNEVNICEYVWTEEVGDLPVKFSSKSDKKEREPGKLTMKVKGYTPRIQNICQAFDTSLKLIIDDVRCFVLSSTHISQKLLFDATLEIEAVRAHLQYACNNLVKRILALVKDSVTNVLKSEASVLLCRLLFLARLCAAFNDLCPNLQKAITGAAISVKEYTRDAFLPVLVTGKFFSQKLEDNAHWQTISEMVVDESLSLFRSWKNMVCEDFNHRVQNLVVANVTDILKFLPKWDTVEIREESEEGVNVNSTISIPMQPSIKLVKLLFWLCSELNNVGGHIIPRPVLQSLQNDVLESIVNLYEKYLNDIKENRGFVTQSMSLQISFDLKFAVGLLTVNSKSNIQDRVQLLCDDLESYVDPFDLDVFSPHINNHLKRCIQRSMIVLGPIALRSGFLNTTRTITSNQQEQHNLLALSTGSRTRFTLLPCGVSTGKAVTKPETEVTLSQPEIKIRHTGKQILNEKSRSTSPKRSKTPPIIELPKSASSSFFGAMSSSWFGS